MVRALRFLKRTSLSSRGEGAGATVAVATGLVEVMAEGVA
jgi:hypothetical protein